MSVTADEVRSAILARVEKPLAASGLSAAAVPDDFDLLGEGLIDSFGLLELISGIEDEFGRTCRALLAVTGQERLLARERLLRASIDRRNPFVDPMSLLQVELLRRSRAASNGDGDELARASFLAINGIAAGMRNTG